MGGLTLLPPYILTAGQQRLEFEVKVFYLVNGKDELDTETRKIVALLAEAQHKLLSPPHT